MGGPCSLAAQEGSLRKRAPPCTDNFQLRRFVYDGTLYFSCEHAYQAAKFRKGSRPRRQVDSIVPKRLETASGHGMRCWSIGGLPCKKDDYHPSWDRDKVGIMLAVNRAKYAQNPELQESLLSTGSVKIIGGPSTQWVYRKKTHTWGVWNGRIQNLIREELKKPEDRTPGVLEKLQSIFREYGVSEEVLQQQLTPFCADTASDNEPICVRSANVADIELVLQRDAAVYPTDDPITAETLASLIKQQPNLSLFYHYATKKGSQNVAGFIVCFALNQQSWFKLLGGELSEADVVAGKGGEHLVNLQSNPSQPVAIHCYHIEKFSSDPQLKGFGIKALRDIRNRMSPKAKIVGLSALCVTAAGIRLFKTNLKCSESPTYPEEAKEQMWLRTTDALAASSSSKSERNPEAVSAPELLVLSRQDSKRIVQDQQQSDKTGGGSSEDTPVIAVKGKQYKYLNDCCMLFATPKSAPSSPAWKVLLRHDQLDDVPEA